MMRQLKKGYTSTSYARKNKKGEFIPLEQVTEECAKQSMTHTPVHNGHNALARVQRGGGEVDNKVQEHAKILDPRKMKELDGLREE